MEQNILMLTHYPPGLERAWKQYGYRVIEDKERISDLEQEELADKISEINANDKLDYVFSFDFFVNVAEVCFRYGIIYISWIVDSPHSTLWNKAARYATNRIFAFDYLQWQELYEAGNTQVYHLPLATDVELFQNIIHGDTTGKGEKYAADVSFMGALYDKGPNNLYDKIQYLPPYTKGYLDGLIKAQRHVWGSNLIHAAITDNVWEELRANVRLELDTEYDERVYEDFIESIIYKKIAQLERKEMCGELARRFDFVLYSGSDTSYDEKINNKGYIDYVNEMPFVFNNSKINLNITLHGISTGIPLRVFDILACGGFCLTNYQEEIAAYFEDGVELVIYTDFQDMYEKIAYYLEHEEERQAIAQAGYEKVRSQFDYIHSVGKIVSVLEDGTE